ncbi:MAG: heme exporter protein CcmD [Pseudomonadota bacterium]|nr:heme exporter protein CcmD [Pseudomonadota bacterium]
MIEFLHMGGYAPYIWTSYGIALLLMAGLLVQSVRQARAATRESEALKALRPRRRRQRQGSDDE